MTAPTKEEFFSPENTVAHRGQPTDIEIVTAKEIVVGDVIELDLGYGTPRTARCKVLDLKVDTETQYHGYPTKWTVSLEVVEHRIRGAGYFWTVPFSEVSKVNKVKA